MGRGYMKKSILFFVLCMSVGSVSASSGDVPVGGPMYSVLFDDTDNASNVVRVGSDRFKHAGKNTAKVLHDDGRWRIHKFVGLLNAKRGAEVTWTWVADSDADPSEGKTVVNDDAIEMEMPEGKTGISVRGAGASKSSITQSLMPFKSNYISKPRAAASVLSGGAAIAALVATIRAWQQYKRSLRYKQFISTDKRLAKAIGLTLATLAAGGASAYAGLTARQPVKS